MWPHFVEAVAVAAFEAAVSELQLGAAYVELAELVCSKSVLSDALERDLHLLIDSTAAAAFRWAMMRKLVMVLALVESRPLVVLLSGFELPDEHLSLPKLVARCHWLMDSVGIVPSWRL